MMNTIERRYLEDWKKFETSILQEKRLVESVISMLNGMTFDNKSHESFPNDKYVASNDSWGDFDESRNTKYKFYGNEKMNQSNLKETKYNRGDADAWGPPPPKAEYPKPNNTIRNPSMQKRPPANIPRTNAANMTNGKGY